MQLTIIRCEDALIVSKSTENKLEVSQQVHITTQLNKLNYFLQKFVVSAPPSINLKIDSGATHHFI